VYGAFIWRGTVAKFPENPNAARKLLKMKPPKNNWLLLRPATSQQSQSKVTNNNPSKATV
jgi:hypothetical protein